MVAVILAAVLIVAAVAVSLLSTVYRTRVGAISAGTTAGTYGTSVSVSLPSEAKYLLGLDIVGVDPTYTTAEGAAAVVRLKSNSFQGDFQLLTGPYTTSGPATNSSGQTMETDSIALIVDGLGGGDSVSVAVTPTATITTARLYEAVLISSDQAPPQEWYAYCNDGAGPFRWASCAMSAQTTTARTGLTTTGDLEVPIKVPNWVRAIRGVRAIFLKNGAITAGEELLAYYDLMNTSLQKIGDQTFLSNGLGATLGTPVGTGMAHDYVPWQRCVIPIGGKNQTITPSINVRTAVTTAAHGAICLAGQ